MDIINCVECDAKLNENSLEIEDIDFITADESGTVGGEYHVNVSINCNNGCHLTTKLQFFPASCPCVTMKDVDDHNKYDIIEKDSRYINNPSGFHIEGYGWILKLRCSRCGNERRDTYTINSLTPDNFKLH